jgi:hypothetical protein
MATMPARLVRQFGRCVHRPSLKLYLMNTDLTISFCTMCMNRVHHLKETLIKNIKDTLPDANVEFVVLDYNSKDGMDQWCVDNCSQYIKGGVVKYYKTNEPNSFNMAHSKNMVCRLATGDIICIVDADNFIGEGFASFIRQAFKQDPNVFLTTIDDKRTNARDVLGRMCFWKKDFVNLRGFDEFMTGYGFDDYDMFNRLMISGRKAKAIPLNYLKAISHSMASRIENMPVYSEFERLFVRHISPLKTEIIYLFKTGDFSFGTLRNLKMEHARSFDNLFHPAPKYEVILESLDWEGGKFQESPDGFTFDNFHSKLSKARYSPESLRLRFFEQGEDVHYWQLIDYDLILELLSFHPMIRNRNRMEQNKQTSNLVPNSVFGKGVVYKNFNNQISQL